MERGVKQIENQIGKLKKPGEEWEVSFNPAFIRDGSGPNIRLRSVHSSDASVVEFVSVRNCDIGAIMARLRIELKDKEKKLTQLAEELENCLNRQPHPTASQIRPDHPSQ